MKFVFWFFLIVVFTGCTENDRVLSVSQLEGQVKQCVGSETPPCLEAVEKYAEFQYLGQELASSPQEFGLKVINIQTDIGRLKEKIVQLENDSSSSKQELKKFQKKLSQQQSLCRKYIAVLRWLEAPNA